MFFCFCFCLLLWKLLLFRISSRVGSLKRTLGWSSPLSRYLSLIFWGNNFFALFFLLLFINQRTCTGRPGWRDSVNTHIWPEHYLRQILSGAPINDNSFEVRPILIVRANRSLSFDKIKHLLSKISNSSSCSTYRPRDFGSLATTRSGRPWPLTRCSLKRWWCWPSALWNAIKHGEGWPGSLWEKILWVMLMLGR